MMNKLRNKEGFTLIEIIFSVAFLCVVSVIVLRLFVASYEIESKTDLVDMATLHLVNEIETIKSLVNIKGEENTVEVFYDHKWQKTKKASANFQVLVVVEKNDLYDRGLYDIKGSVIDLNTKENIADVETMHYYNGKE